MSSKKGVPVRVRLSTTMAKESTARPRLGRLRRKALAEQKQKQQQKGRQKDVSSATTKTTTTTTASLGLQLSVLKTNLEHRDWNAVRGQLREAVAKARSDHEAAVAVAAQKALKAQRWRRKRGSKQPPEIPYKSPLLAKSSSGRTAIHWCLLDRTIPTDIVLYMIKDAPDIAATYDNKFQLPLHIAVQRGQSLKIIAELMVANPLAINQDDLTGRTPLEYAAAIAKKQTSSEKIQSWATPEDDHTLRWQDGQDLRWAVVRYLLLASASHPQTKIDVGDGQPLLLDVMVHSAPPSVVSLLIAASSGILQSGKHGVAFACSGLYLCISRKYPTPILKSLTQECQDEVRIVRDETGTFCLLSRTFFGGTKPDSHHHKKEWDW